MYAQYVGGVFRELAGNIAFSDSVFQSAESLTQLQRTEFNVYNIIDVFVELPINHLWLETWSYEVVGADIKRFWTPILMTDAQLEAQRVASVPAVISARQLRHALTRAGLREIVETAIAYSDMNTRDWYEFSVEIHRTHPKVIQLAAELNVSTRNLDDLWTLAATL